MTKFKQVKQKGGIAVLLAVLVLSGLLVISLAVSNLIIRQVVLSRQMELSAGAYQAADAGIEYSLYKYKEGFSVTNEFLNAVGLTNDTVCSGGSVQWFSLGKGEYCLEPIDKEGSIDGFKSIGRYNGTRRGIEINIYISYVYVRIQAANGGIRCRIPFVSFTCDFNANIADCTELTYPATASDPEFCYDWRLGSASNAIQYRKMTQAEYEELIGE